MNTTTLAIAAEDWPWVEPRYIEPFCGDNLIALAVDCRSQINWRSAPLTDEAAVIIGYDGRGFDNDRNRLRYIRSLNL